MPSVRATSVVDATKRNGMKKPDGPRPVGSVALLGQRRGSM